MPHHCRRIGHAGLAGAIFEYGRNLGTGDWSALSHLSDVDLKPQTSIRSVLSGRPSLKTMVRHAAVVAVDTSIGQVEILDYVAVEDCGTLVNPMVVEGQSLGGIAQGIGTALYEESPFDANGQPLASTFADYLLPGPTEIPAIRIFHMRRLKTTMFAQAARSAWTRRRRAP